MKRTKLHSELSQSKRWGRREKYSSFKELEVKKNAFQSPPLLFPSSPKLHVYTLATTNRLPNVDLKAKRGTEGIKTLKM